MKSLFKTLLVAGGIAIPASAFGAVFTYDMVVVESVDENAQVIAPEFVLPDVGTFGTVTIDLDGAALDADGDPDTAVNGSGILDSSLAGASASFGTLSSEITEPTWFSSPGRARISNTDFASIIISLAGVDCLAIGCTFAGSFAVENAAYAAPTTFAEIESMLGDPTSDIVFSFNGTVALEFVAFRAERGSAPVIPLPASGALLLSAVVIAGAFRRRSGRAL